MGISIAYRIKAVPAYVIEPDGPLSTSLLPSDRRALQKFQLMREIFYKGIATATIQPNPPGSSEGAPQLRQRADGSWTNSDGERNGSRDATPPIGPSTLIQVNNTTPDRGAVAKPQSAR